MNSVSVIHFSGMGHTRKMAEAVAQGASTVRTVQVNLIAIEGNDISEGRYKNDGVFEKIGCQRCHHVRIANVHGRSGGAAVVTWRSYSYRRDSTGSRLAARQAG